MCIEYYCFQCTYTYGHLALPFCLGLIPCYYIFSRCCFARPPNFNYSVLHKALLKSVSLTAPFRVRSCTLICLAHGRSLLRATCNKVGGTDLTDAEPTRQGFFSCPRCIWDPGGKNIADVAVVVHVRQRGCGHTQKLASEPALRACNLVSLCCAWDSSFPRPWG